jgi:hypothetical protein
MAYEQRDLTGSLFKNTRKEADTHADYNGSALINGVEYFLDAWINEPKGGGDKYMSVKFKPKGQRGGGGGATPRPQPAAFDTDLDDDVPFASLDPALEHRVR